MKTETNELFPERGELAALVRSKDWSQTPLGAPETWPASLCTVLRLMLTSRYSMWMGWGPQLTFLYNDAYAQQTLGPKHPGALGRPASEVWAEIWPTVGPRVEQVLSTGEATWDEGLLLFLERNGYAEETYHTFSYSPAPGDLPGDIAGLFCVVIEETERVVGGRRIALLRDFAARLSHTNEAGDVLAAVDASLATSPRDIVFALTYLFDDDEQTARLAASTGFGEGHPAAVERVPIDSASWPFRELRSDNAPIVVALSRERSWPTGAWTEPPSHAVVIPIVYQGVPRPAGVFIAGLNPHRPQEQGLLSFVELFAGQLAAGLSNARAYEAAKSRADALAEIDRAKTIFFSNVSHEFRTPLSLMLGPTEDALSSPDRALRGADLETVHRNELRLLKLVNALLDFARIEAGRIQASYRPTDLALLTTDLASSFRSAIERAGLVFHVDAKATGTVFVDHDMWEKIVLNLLSNALKFTFEGSISVSLHDTGDRVLMTVADTGVGIAADELPRLFERFHRIEGTRARTHEGSGIGLALVQDLVDLHGGTIDVASAPGKGTTFTVSIPRGSTHLAPESVTSSRPTPSTSISAAYLAEALRWTAPGDAHVAPDATPATDRPRIVVADDNGDMRDYLARLLRERWDVQLFADGQAALDSIRRSPPALVVSDVMMPGVDGFALVRAIRGDPALRAIPVILLSARAGEEAAADGLHAGADDYIVKPFAARDLLVRIASRLAAADAAREAHAVKENLYRHFMQAPFPIAVFRGSEHVIELANAATLLAWGKTEAEAVGHPLVHVIPELRGQPFIGYLDGVLRSGVTYEGRAESARLPTPGGETEEVFFTFVYAPLFDGGGNTEGVLMSAFDVTEQVRSRHEVEVARDRAEELAGRLLNTTERLRAAQRVGRVGTFDWDLSKGSVDWSPELFALMGLSLHEINSTADAWTERLFDESDRQVWASAFQTAAAAHDTSFEVELRLRQPDGQSRWVRLSAELQYDGKGNAARLLGAAVDVQLLKEAAAARARALEEAERTGRAKDEFLATMSHELRTPLNSMLGWAKVLRQSSRDEHKLEHGLRVIERNAESQARLISDLLDVSRIISGKLRLAVQRVSLATVIHAAVDVARQAGDSKGVRLVVDLDPDLGTMVGDPDRLQQIVWNLLSNAVKFTPAGGTVTVAAGRRESKIAIRVSDNGLGIEHEHLALIFERFRQVDSSTTRTQGGLGLGLAIVRQLVEGHGGRVEALSEGIGKGSAFVVTLPLHAVLVEAAPAVRDAGMAPAGTTSPDAPGGPLAGLTILVVDDDPDSMDLVSIVLQGAGASVVSAPSAIAALEAQPPHAFDVLVSDIGMPEMDGYDFIRALRSRSVHVPAIALTAYARIEDARKARDAGYEAHIAKPVDAQALIGAIARLRRTGT